MIANTCERVTGFGPGQPTGDVRAVDADVFGNEPARAAGVIALSALTVVTGRYRLTIPPSFDADACSQFSSG